MMHLLSTDDDPPDGWALSFAFASPWIRFARGLLRRRA